MSNHGPAPLETTRLVEEIVTQLKARRPSFGLPLEYDFRYEQRREIYEAIVAALNSDHPLARRVRLSACIHPTLRQHSPRSPDPLVIQANGRIVYTCITYDTATVDDALAGIIQNGRHPVALIMDDLLDSRATVEVVLSKDDRAEIPMFPFSST